MTHAESPVLLEIGGSVRDPVWPFRQGKEMLLQFSEAHRPPDRDAVPDDMEIRLRKVDDLLPFGVPDIRVLDVPFLRDGPVEYRSATLRLAGLKGHASSDDLQSLAHPVSSHAPADRIKLGDQIVHPSTCVLKRQGFCECGNFSHGYTLTSGIGVTNCPPHFRIWDICAMISSLKFQGRIST